MKKRLIIKIAVAFIIAILGIPTIIFGFSSSFSWDDVRNERPESLSYKSEKFINLSANSEIYLNIDWRSGNVKISTHQMDYVIIRERSANELQKKEKLDVAINENNINIAWSNLTYENEKEYTEIYKDLEIVLPSKKDVIICDIDTNKSDISIEGIQPHRLNIKADRSDLDLKNFKCEVLDADIYNGNINLDVVDISSVDVRTQSANSNFSNADIGKLNVLSDGGNISFLGKCKSMDMKTVLGNMYIDINSIIENLRIENLFGTANIINRKTNDFLFKSKNHNGEINLDDYEIEEFEGKQYFANKKSENIFELSTTSGSITLSKD